MGSGRCECVVDESVEDIDANDDEDRHCVYMSSLVSKCSVNLDIVKNRERRKSKYSFFFFLLL